MVWKKVLYKNAPENLPGRGEKFGKIYMRPFTRFCLTKMANILYNTVVVPWGFRDKRMKY